MIKEWDGEITKGIRWLESEMVRFPLCEGNKMIREWDGEITTVWSGNKMISEWDGEIIHCHDSGNKMIREWDGEITTVRRE